MSGTKSMYIRVPEELHDELSRRAKSEGRSIAEVSAHALARGIGWTAEYRVVKETLVITPAPVPEAFRLGAEARRLGIVR